MRRVPALLAVATLAVTGCSFSSVDPDSSVQVTGRALDASGKPLADARVLLVRQADIGQVLFGTVLAVGTLSTVCLLPEPPAICAKARTATTDSEGRYHFEVKGADTQGSLGTEATMNVVFSDGREASTTLSFAAKDTDVTLPDARVWNLRPRVSARPGRVEIEFKPLPSGAGRRTSYGAEVFDGDAGSALWTQPARGSHAEVDTRLLEDRDGAVAVSAHTELAGGSGTGDVRAGYLSPRLAVRAGSGPPPSRDRRCAAVTGTAPVVTTRWSRCAATDGDLDRPARLSAPGGAIVTGVVVDLGAPRAVDLVVARGFAGQLLVEVSSDGRTFRTVATSAGTTAVSPQGRPSARFVRLRSPAGVDESLLSEVSIW